MLEKEFCLSKFHRLRVIQINEADWQFFKIYSIVILSLIQCNRTWKHEIITNRNNTTLNATYKHSQEKTNYK